MSWWKRSLSLVALAAFFAAPAHAQLGGHPYELSAGAGINSFDARDFIQDSPVYLGALGWRYSPGLTLEAAALGAPTKLDRPGDIDRKWSYVSLDARWNLRDASEKAVPYLITGMGYGRAQDAVGGLVKKGAPSIGAGFLYSLMGSQRTYLRLQVRDVMFREHAATEFSHHIAASAGLQWAWGGKAKDQDLDGVRNWLDKCPNTPIGAKVDATGCPIDSDGDGVYDGIDKCPNTPKGAKIDKNGCPIDTDGDGVPDGIDKCDNTPKGAKVDAAGCPIDSDGDGVWDGLDKCENTPKGAVVDKDGCPVDTDGDGVPDGLDQCPNTPAGLKVDPTGCPIEVSERETQLLDTGTIRIQNINFDVNKASIKDSTSFAILDDVAKILLQYPALTLEIGGHTDNSGVKAKNMTLSEARAKTVLSYLTQKYPTLDASHFTVKGYGPTMPIAPNTSVLGKSKNRRVEFKVTNTEVLKIEREKRHFVQKGEAAPAADPNKK
jgi:OOP family OmpA-OmpF porin